MSTLTLPDWAVAARPGARRIGTAEGSCILLLAAAAVLVLWWRWVGYQGHDDAFFAAAALEWVEHYPALGTNHWALRYPLVLPIAGLIALFGTSVFVLTVVNVLAYAGFLAVSYAAVRHWFGWKAAVAMALIGIVVPEFPVQATYANPDLTEMALVVASVWCLVLARQRGGPWPLMLLCGLLMGLGFLTRETAILLVPFFGLLFLFRPCMPRWRYLFIAVGFAALVGGQMAYFAARTGDPFYRMRISASHDHVDRTAMSTRASATGRTVDTEGVLAIAPALVPVAAVFVSQKFGLLFYFAIPAYAVLRRGRKLSPAQASVLDTVSLAALVSFLFVALNAEILYVVPRYFIVTAALAAVPVAVLAADLLERGRRVLLGSLAAVFVVSSLGLLYLENIEPLFAENRILDMVETAGETVHVDPRIAWRMHYLVKARGLEERISVEPPRAGDLVAGKAGEIEACLDEPGCVHQDRVRPFLPGPGWVELRRAEPRPRLAGEALRALGLDRAMPRDIFRKIDRPNAGAVLYRLPAAS